jgi:anti-sigma28 factor (negative regulator of flagellin synthesis)
MRIEGVYIQSGISKTEQKKRSNPDVKGKSDRGDRVELSKQARVLRARGEETHHASSASSAKASRTEAAREKVREGGYDRPEVRKEIAARLLKSPGFREILEGRARPAGSSPIPRAGADRVQIAKERVQKGFYDRTEVRSAVAGKLLQMWLP